MRRPRHYYSKLESGFFGGFLLVQWSGSRCCGTLLMISANALSKDLCLGREREDICLPSSLHHCVSCQRLFLTVFQILCVGRNVAVLFSSAAGILRPVFPCTSVSQMMLRGMWQSITLKRIIYVIFAMWWLCVVSSHAAGGKGRKLFCFICFLVNFVFSLNIKTLFHNCTCVFVSHFCCSSAQRGVEKYCQ